MPPPPAKPTLARSIAAALLLGLQLIVSLLLSVAFAQRLFLFARIRGGVPVSAKAFQAGDFVIVAGSRLLLPLLVASAIAFLLWLYRVCENLRAYRTRAFEFTPGEAVGSFFIPFLNLYRPYEAVREAWLASDPAEPPLSPTDDARVLADRAPLVVLWWMFFVLRGLPALCTAFTPGTAASPQMERMTVSGYGMLLSHLMAIPAAALAMVLVYSLDRRQDALGDALERHKRRAGDAVRGDVAVP